MDDFASPPRRAERPPRRTFWLFLGLIAMMALGGAVTLVGATQAGLVTWHGFRPQAAPHPARPAAPVAAPAPVASATATPLPAEQAQAGLGMRVAELEQRVARIDAQAEATSGNAARAEGLMVAFAARRTIERGQPLGALESQLKLRFGDAQPNAVATLIDAGQHPVTRDGLLVALGGLAPELAQAPRGEGAWDRFQREISGLFVIRKATAPSPLPQRRLDRARAEVAAGQVESAIGEVERLPGRDAAASWLADARRYVIAERALDLIETAALMEAPEGGAR